MVAEGLGFLGLLSGTSRNLRSPVLKSRNLLLLWCGCCSEEWEVYPADEGASDSGTEVTCEHRGSCMGKNLLQATENLKASNRRQDFSACPLCIQEGQLGTLHKLVTAQFSCVHQLWSLGEGSQELNGSLTVWDLFLDLVSFICCCYLIPWFSLAAVLAGSFRRGLCVGRERSTVPKGGCLGAFSPLFPHSIRICQAWIPA